VRKSFLQLTPVAGFEEILSRCDRKTGTETIPTAGAVGRIPSADVLSPGDLPEFRRSTVDGYAVMSADTHGASESIPVYLDLTDDIPIGTRAERPLTPGRAARVVTGGMVPEGADAVVMVEHTNRVDEKTIEVRTSSAALDNVAPVGEDISLGGLVVPAARPLRPFEVGALMGLGIVSVKVFKRPVVCVFSTGPEVVEPTETPGPGQVRDINKYGVAAGIAQAGGVPVLLPTVTDDRKLLTRTISDAADASDMVILSGGSSVGAMDFTLEAINDSGRPGVLVHGIAVKPGKPTVFGMVGDVPIVGLPGHPAGALVIFTLFVSPLIRRIGGETGAAPFTQSVTARLARNIAGTPGKHVYIPAALEYGAPGELPRALPILGKSGTISILTRSDGIIVIDPMREGLEAGASVEVHLYRRESNRAIG
jgi:molybdopterin molybdotransferase